jgi:phosphate transport system substrate-binding protein
MKLRNDCFWVPGTVHLALGVLLCLLGAFACSRPTKPVVVDETKIQPNESIPSNATHLRGAGATFPSFLYRRWFSAYHEINQGTYVTYDAVGSAEGVRRFIGKDVSNEQSVDFAGSDAAMSDAEITKADNNVLMIPATAGCVVLAYNLPGYTGELRLSRRTYTEIFEGDIKDWSDPQIARDNPGIKFPHLTIATVVRQDGSGTTFAFTRNLDTISEKWRALYGPATLVDWPGNAMRATGNQGVAALIEKSAGSIGYVGYEFGRRIGLNFATLENKDAKYVKPSEQNCGKALATAVVPENLRIFVPDPPGADSYPLVTFTWILVHKSYRDASTADEIRRLLRWSLQDGQRYASELGYVALPSEVAKQALAAVDTIGPRSR